MSGRRDSNDIVSFEILIKVHLNESYIIISSIVLRNTRVKLDRFVTRTRLTTRETGSALVIIGPSAPNPKYIYLAALLPGGKEALEKYGRRGLVFDDTFHTTTYNFRLATLIVLDHSDNGIPVGIVISNKMTSDDAAQLFHVIKVVTTSKNRTRNFSSGSNRWF